MTGVTQAATHEMHPRIKPTDDFTVPTTVTVMELQQPSIYRTLPDKEN